MKKTLTFTLAIVMLISLFVFVACDKPNPPEVVPAVDYSATNNFEFSISETEDFVTYTPDANATHGFLFYLGTSVAPQYYDYLASALAKQGYVVVISTNGFPYMFYDKDEPTFEEYPNVKFFVGGHSQGGAAAVKRTNENRDKVVGVVLLAPLAYPTDSIADADIPVLLLEATNDGVLTADMKSNARRSIPYDSEHHILEGCHMSFSTLDSDETLTMFHDGPATPEQKEAQRASTLSFVLAFMNRIASTN